MHKSVKWPCYCILVATGMFAPAQESDNVQPVREIAVTKTWSDLLRQDATALDEEVSVRLGIEASRCGAGGGILLYVLTEGYQPPEKWSNPNRVGPVLVTVGPPGQSRSEEHSSYQSAAGDPPSGILLFVRTIPMPDREPVEISVQTREGRHLAKATIRPADEAYHPWLPLERVRNLHGDLARSIPVFANRDRGRALPTWDPMAPLVFEGVQRGRQVKLARHAALPSLIPDRVNENWKVTTFQDDDGFRRLIITSRVTFVTARPDWHILTRWWVNETAFIPASLTEIASDENGLIVYGNRLNLALKFDPKRIGAKSRDRITCQLMYVQDGWSWMAPVESLHAAVPGDTETPVLLNPVEWVVP